MSGTLSYKVIREAVSGSAAAFRLSLKLEAVSPKVFPPTYEGGKYATETRWVNGAEVPSVLLDSVPSQANRMEFALQEVWESSEIELPVVSVDFTGLENPAIQKITSLQAPHRIVDAILRDSFLGRDRFRVSSVGKALDQLSIANATPLLKYAPHCLVFGMWDSTGPRGGLGVKFSRSVTSEIVGIHAVQGVKTSSRIDPLNIRVSSGVLFKANSGWTLNEKEAVKEKGKPVRLGKDGKPSEANHGNVTPSVSDGGFTIDHAEQTTVLSLSALRRLRFPTESTGKPTCQGNDIARSYLTALGLLGATLAAESGYDLRSRCILRAKDPIVWQLLGAPGVKDQDYVLGRSDALALYKEALAAVRNANLPIETDELVLTPTDDLVTLVKKSMELAAVEGGGE